MATSSITHNFVITGKEKVERFANLLDELWHDKELRGENPEPWNSGVVEDPEEIKKLIAAWRAQPDD